MHDFYTEKFDDYIIYHDYNLEELTQQAKEFFNEGNFNRDIVDLFVHATGIALDIQLNIFRRSPGGHILEIFQGNTKSSRSINLKLSGTGGKYTGDNHYDALPIKYKNLQSLPPILEYKGNEREAEKKRRPDEPSSSYMNLTSGIFKPPANTSLHVDEFIDLTQSPVKVPGSFSDTESLYASTEEGSISTRSDFQERMESLNGLSEDGEEVETESGTQSHVLTLEHENVDEVIEQPSTIFPSFLFKKTKPKKVDFLPHNITGNAYYKVKCTVKNYAKKTSDRRWFSMRTSSRKGMGRKGIRKVGTCQGS